MFGKLIIRILKAGDFIKRPLFWKCIFSLLKADSFIKRTIVKEMYNQLAKRRCFGRKDQCLGNNNQNTKGR